MEMDEIDRLLTEMRDEEKRAEGRAEGRIQATIESAVEFDRPEEETIARLVKKFSPTEEQAKEYYDMYAPQSV